MATLTGKKIKNTYKDLLQISNSNAGIDGTLRTISDGEAITSVLQLSSSAVNIASAGALQYAGTAITATGAELNLMDGGTTRGTDAVADGDGIVTNDGGSMKQTNVQTFSTYFNANAFSAPSAITSTSTLTPGSAKSIYQRVDCTSGAITLTLAVGSLSVGQYIVVDKIDTSGNTLTLAYPSNSQGLSLGSSVEFASAFYNGTHFSFIETVKS